MLFALCFKIKYLVLLEAGVPENMEKNPQYKARTNNKLNPLKAPGLNLSLAHLGRRQVLSAGSQLQEPRPKIVCLFSLQISFRTCYLSINMSKSLLVVRMRSLTLLMLTSVMYAINLQMKQVRSAVHLTTGALI